MSKYQHPGEKHRTTVAYSQIPGKAGENGLFLTPTNTMPKKPTARFFDKIRARLNLQ